MLIKSFLYNESGATAIEYALIIGLIGLAIVGGATQIGSELTTSFGDASLAM